MMIKITKHCSMGCTHCMNDSKPCKQHMDFTTFVSAIEFQNKYGAQQVMITGGEPFEHPDWLYFFMYATQTCTNAVIEIATNGYIMSHDNTAREFVAFCANFHRPVLFQVTSDPKYYPDVVDYNDPIFSMPNVALIKEVPNLYPQGRTVTNNLNWKANPKPVQGSKCYNVRAISHQLEDMGEHTLHDITWTLASKDRYCTPHVGIDGGIYVGESDLCPQCSNIFKPEHEIVEDIRNFECHGCDFINKNLPPKYEVLLHRR